MNILREKARCRPMAGLAYFGGDSSASTTSETDVFDMRVVGGDDSVNVSASGGTLNVSQTDQGAVAAGLALGTKGIDLAATNSAAAFQFGQSMFAGALGAVKESSANALSAVSSARSDVAGAWQNSQTPENSMLKIAGFVVVGVVAVFAFSKR